MGLLAHRASDDFFLHDLKNLCATGSLRNALLLAHHMECLGFSPSTKAFSSLLQACTRLRDIHAGRQVYSWIMRSGFRNVFLRNQLIRMFSSCGSLVEAEEVFRRVERPNLFTWTAMIAAHVEMGGSDMAISLYNCMQRAALGGCGARPDAHLFVLVLKACANTCDLIQGRGIHGDIRQAGLETDTFVANSLLSMYARCECLMDARALFENLVDKDVVTWGAMITAFAQSGHNEDALSLFISMRKEGFIPNRVTFMCALKACSGADHFFQGKCVHSDIVELGLESDIPLSNTLVNMYASCRSLDDARGVFNRLIKKNRVAWNVMVEAYDQEGQVGEAIQLYEQMQIEGIEPDRINFISILKVCSFMASLQQAKLVHSHIAHLGLESEEFICNALIDMYAKCGTFPDAFHLFTKMPERGIVRWNTMICACAQTGEPEMAFKFLEDMISRGVQPNPVTYASLLSMCSHVGYVGGFEYFNLLNHGGMFTSMFDHKNCLVNLFGGIGLLKDAKDILQSMPERPNFVSRRSLLNHCKIHGSLGQGLDCFKTQSHDFAQIQEVCDR